MVSAFTESPILKPGRWPVRLVSRSVRAG